MNSKRIDPAWWEQDALKQALADRDVSAIFAHLQVHGWTQTDLADALGLWQSDVSRIRSGTRRVEAYSVLSRISETFAIPPEYMGLGRVGNCAGDELRTAADSMPSAQDRAELLGVQAALAVGAPVANLERWLAPIQTPRAQAPRRIGSSDVDRVQALAAQLWELDRSAGGGAAVDAATGLLATANDMLRATSTEDTHARLMSVAADLHCLAGWAAHDLGNQASAMRHFTSALAHGRGSDDAAMVAAALYRQGRVSLQIGAPSDALRAFQLGQMAAQDAGSYADLSRLLLSSGWAYALLGQAERMEDSILRAEEELSRIDTSSHVAPWVEAFVHSGDVDGVRSYSYTILARRTTPDADDYAARAVEITERSVRERVRPRRSLIFDEVMYAAGLIQCGDRSGGIAAANVAIDSVEVLRSRRAVERLEDIDRTAARLTGDDGVAIRRRIATLRDE